MARRARLDAELVRRKLARSREQAAQLVAAGRVQVRGTVAHKVAAMVDPADPVIVTGEDPQTEYVSRGGHKLAGALAAFGARGLSVEGRRCLDAGASTGGFTDVLLRAGARRVVAVDVGYGQLAWPIRTDERVDVHERTNVRTLTPDAIGGPVDLTVADLSFISLRLVLPALAACTGPDGDLALMVKPQFEVGKERVGAGGVVRDWRLRAEAVLDVAAAAAELGLGVVDVTASPLPGPSGNVEFFVWFRRGAPAADRDRVEAVVAAGPSGQDPESTGPSGQDPESAGSTGQDPESTGSTGQGPESAGAVTEPPAGRDQERSEPAEQPVAQMEDK
ncbi:23S rRNA (cytidine1920-2'-O)/16S rRNA (cytidine1409-2'-O)-methyltransferase [Actinoplanes regularis]|uniref:23S rRNA (Cytidine1920-2'-O)/16S rRNA (Cytidine1409-2'-O)-methyltransferase n=1 Tax=Actinoplanes regularis TaxID=52697 RepID=A0A239GQ78_9ACTN|nr:TlyA family rRNA (cytidine-2'-O)-methyltransferase [Actinoplanes regularis]SNS71025.1 23S rRNA (cytidine1920-2'-O)/16S rRNA (cytidine1409-2'-O)-methyltransferase [Actinoplanes regularis]